MSSERILGDMTRAYGTLCDKDVYFGNVNCKKLNGVPISVLKSEGNDNLAPTNLVNFTIQHRMRGLLTTKKINKYTTTNMV